MATLMKTFLQISLPGVIRSSLAEVVFLPRGRERIGQRHLGLGGENLNHFRYGVTVMAGKAAQLRTGADANEKLQALLRALTAKVAFAVALLPFRRA